MVDEVTGRGIAYSKVMVLDGATIITGSFNLGAFDERGYKVR